MCTTSCVVALMVLLCRRALYMETLTSIFRDGSSDSSVARFGLSGR